MYFSRYILLYIIFQVETSENTLVGSIDQISPIYLEYLILSHNYEFVKHFSIQIFKFIIFNITKNYRLITAATAPVATPVVQDFQRVDFWLKSAES